MPQVYTFTDSNGEVRLAASINPAPGSQSIVKIGSIAFDDSGIDGNTGPGVVVGALLPVGTVVFSLWPIVTTAWASTGNVALSLQLGLIPPAELPTFGYQVTSSIDDVRGYPVDDGTKIGYSDPSATDGVGRRQAIIHIPMKVWATVTPAGGVETLTAGVADIYALLQT